MVSVLIEQRVNMKFLVKLGKSTSETYSLLQQVHSGECMLRQVFEWYKRFKEGREEFKDDPHHDVLPLRKRKEKLKK